MTDFVLVPASKLSLNDKVMCHTPKTDREQAFKELLTKVIKSGVSDFYRPKIDPSFDKHGKICYHADFKPAVGKSYNWWEKNAKEFCPERKSRLGTKYEYIAFLGVLIKKLVENGWEVSTAWDAVCNDSVKLGHYHNSMGELYKLQPTGSREICGFCDLANAYKLFSKNKENDYYWIAGGSYRERSYYFPLARFYHFNTRFGGAHYIVGWVILEK